MIEKLISISEPWLQYAIKLNLFNENKTDLEALKKEALKDEKIQTYLRDISDFHSMLVSNHKNPELPIHKLLFLLDIGFDMDIPEIENAVNQLLSQIDDHGVYQSLTNIPKHYGGAGTDIFGWCLCDAPLLLLALIKAKVDYEKYIKQGVDYLVSLTKMQGFPCSVSEELGKFRGPGRKDDCCPYATLIMLKLLSYIDEYRNSDIVRDCIDSILSLWENSLERHPYMFYMGTDFRKLKAPAMWYDIVSVADCLSKYEYARTDTRFSEMISIIKSKQNEDDLITPESVYQKCKPSRIILGIGDSAPRKGAYITSGFAMGETRTFLVRIHNYEEFDLKDILKLELPEGIRAKSDEIPIFVKAGRIKEYRVNLTCAPVTDCGVFKIRVTLKNTGAAPAVQALEISYPLRALPVYRPLEENSEIQVEFTNFSDKQREYQIRLSHPSAEVSQNESCFNLAPRESAIITGVLGKGNYPLEAKMTADISSSENSTSCDIVIPLNYVENLNAGQKHDGQMNIIAGYNLLATFGDSNAYGALIGMAKPEPLLAYSKIWLDNRYLYAFFDVKDKTVVCAKLGRRNNIDCDGVWFKLFKSIDDKEPFRHFTAVPADQNGSADGANIDEIAGNVLFAENYSDYNLKNVSLKSFIYNGDIPLKCK